VLAEPPSEATDTLVWAAAVLAVLRHWGVVARGKQSANAWSPWEVADAWRMNGIGYQDIVLRRGEAIVTIRAHPQTAGYRLDLPSGSVSAEADDETSLRLEGVVRNVPVVRQGAKLTVIVEGRNFEVEHVDPLAPPAAATAAENYVIAPLPARIVRVLVKPGDAVQRGAALLVLEAMKMEVILSAPKDSVVERVHGAVDDMVEEGSELVTFVGGNPA
jgi:3-methylcrotonyl-CoA carboxylase alpha subunit